MHAKKNKHGLNKKLIMSRDEDIELRNIDEEDFYDELDQNEDIEQFFGLKFARHGKILSRVPEDFEGILEIPEGVEILANNALRSCYGITQIIIPSTFQIFARCAFRNSLINTSFSVSPDNEFFSTSQDGKSLFSEEGSILVKVATNIEEYIVPENVKKIGPFAFHNCKNLKNIVLHNDLSEIAASAFSGCRSLVDIILPDSIKKIGSWAFLDCISLESIHLPKELNKITTGLLSGCTSLKEIHIPETVKNISQEAFSNCSVLESIHIPLETKKIDSSAFQGCASLRFITVDENNKKYMAENNVLYDYHQTTLVRCSVDYEEFDISEYISTIESYAFSDCENLSKITLPQYLTAIKEYTFANCPKLESIDIPENVTKIGFGAFENCVSLKKITFHQFSHLKAVGPFAFAECSSLEEIQLPPTVTTIGTKAENGGCSFSGCESLIEMDIPAKVDFLNEAMFYNCKNLKKVIIPYNMNYIDQDLFYGCDNLEEVVLRNANTVIEDGTFDEKVKITIENQNINKIYFEI